MKNFTIEEIRDLLNQVYNEEISFSQMVEVINKRVSGAEKKCVKDIPKCKFKKGDKVRIKDGVSSKTHRNASCKFMEDMDKYIGQKLTVAHVGESAHYGIYYTMTNGGYNYAEDWLEPYTEELKKGDLAIFWDKVKKHAIITFYERSYEDETCLRHKDIAGSGWENAIKFESKEQYEQFIKENI